MTKIMLNVLSAAIFAGGLQMHTVPVCAADDETAVQLSAQDGKLDCLVEEDGNYRYYEDGQLVTDSWITTEDGMYYFDRSILTSAVTVIWQLVWDICLDFILRKTFDIHMQRHLLPIFGEGGIYHYPGGFGNICIYRWEATETDVSGLVSIS